MKRLLIILLFGCTATKIKLSGRSDVSVPVYTNEQLTAFHIQDSLEIVELKKNIVYLPKSQWIIDSTGAAIMRGTDSLTVNYLMVQAPKIDTTNHGGIDSIPMVPIDSTTGMRTKTIFVEGKDSIMSLWKQMILMNNITDYSGTPYTRSNPYTDSLLKYIK